MKRPKFTVLISLVSALVLAPFAMGVILTKRAEQSEEQEEFIKSSPPEALPGGFFWGSAKWYRGSWQGMRFDEGDATGINVFREEGDLVRKFPFIVSKGTGSRDDVTVIRLDFDIPENPLWLRPVTAELRQTSPGHFLGKLHIGIVPGVPFTVTYFKLER